MYLIRTVPNDILEKLDEEINKTSLKKHNHHLAGNIKKEMAIPEAKKYLLNFLASLVEEHKEKFHTFKDAQKICNNDNIQFDLISLWANFQKKYEFNPLHDHGGLFSFVIWHKIPYLIQDEESVFPETKKGFCKAGCFAFVYTNTMGDVLEDTLPVDKTWEGKIAFFPAKLNHLVYPFYSSDEERITISGNLILKV